MTHNTAKTSEPVWDSRNSDEWSLPNDTKIRFCNAMHALRFHGKNCQYCADYLWNGDGDLCNAGKRIICELAFADTTPTTQGEGR